jgi:hypothetical protein
MKINAGKIGGIPFCRKTDVLTFSYDILPHTACDLGASVDFRLHFRRHVDYLFSQTTALLLLTRLFIAFTFPSLDTLMMPALQ